jgi:hypothetical protein
MAVSAEEPSTSDNDGAERPVRKKLSETTIESTPQNATPDVADTPVEDAQTGNSSRASSRGRKRSFDEDETEKKDGYSEESDGSNHRRKRSRDSNTEDPEAKESAAAQDPDDTAGKISSPKKKRSRDQVDKDEAKGEIIAEKPEGKDSPENGGLSAKPAKGEPEKKRHRDDSRERDTAADSKVCLEIIYFGIPILTTTSAAPRY